MLHDPGLLQPEPLSPWQSTADPCLCRKQSNTQRQVWLSLCGVSGSWCAQGFVWSLWASLAGRLGLILNVVLPLQLYYWDFSFALERGASFFFFFLVKSNILLSMIVQQWVAILEFSQEKTSAHPSTLPSLKFLRRVQVQLFWKTVGYLLQNYHTLAMQSSNCTHWYLHKGVENLCPNKNVHMDVHISHNCPNLETTNISFGVWMDK